MDVQIPLNLHCRCLLERLGLFDDAADPRKTGNLAVDRFLKLGELFRHFLPHLRFRQAARAERFVKLVVVQVDAGHELVLFLEHQRLENERLFADDLFDLFGVDVLAGGPQEHVLQTAADVDVAIVVDETKVAGAEPTVFREDFRGDLGRFVVAFHHVVALDLELPFTGFRVRAVDAHRHPGEHRADRSELRVERRTAGDQRRRLRQAVTDRVGEARLDQKTFGLHREGSSTDAEETQLAAEGLEQFLAGEPVESPPNKRNAVERPDQGVCSETGLHPHLVDLLDHQGHAENDGRLDLRHRGYQHCGRRWLAQVADAGAPPQREQETKGALVGVGHRQDRQEAVVIVDGDDLCCRLHVEHQVAVAQHDPLRVAGGARCVDDAGEVVRRDLVFGHAPEFACRGLGGLLEPAELLRACLEGAAQAVLGRVRGYCPQVVHEQHHLQCFPLELFHLGVEPL